MLFNQKTLAETYQDICQAFDMFVLDVDVVDEAITYAFDIDGLSFEVVIAEDETVFLMYASNEDLDLFMVDIMSPRELIALLLAATEELGFGETEEYTEEEAAEDDILMHGVDVATV